MAGLTPLQMLQEFQVHYDKVDVEGLPRMYPEQVFIFLNTAQLEYCKQARAALEQNTQLTEDLRSLVVDGVISPTITSSTLVTYPLSQVRKQGSSILDPPLPHFYVLMGRALGLYQGKDGIVPLREVSHNQWQAFLQNPQTSPRPSLCPYRFTQKGILVAKPEDLRLGPLEVTVVVYPPDINSNTPCTLSPQLHRPLVLRAVELATQSINRGNQLTQNQD